jgi:tight adherence protein B
MHFGLLALYFVAALLALEGLASLLRRGSADPTRVRKRLQTLARHVAEGDVRQSMLRNGSRFGLPSQAGLALLLYRAGGTMTVRRFVALSVGVAALGLAAAFVLTHDPLRSSPAMLLGLLPWISVRRTARRRMHLFEEQLPEALELITRSLRTGHALDAGFQMVGEEFDDPIGSEFALVAEEIRLGLEVREALANLMQRVANDDLPYFTTAVLIQRQTGGNLAELLDKLGRLLRERIQFHGRVRALTAQGRGAATFLALWLPFIIVVVGIVAPDYLEPLLVTDWGNAILATAFGIDAVAYFLALRFADVQA